MIAFWFSVRQCYITKVSFSVSVVTHKAANDKSRLKWKVWIIFLKKPGSLCGHLHGSIPALPDLMMGCTTPRLWWPVLPLAFRNKVWRHRDPPPPPSRFGKSLGTRTSHHSFLRTESSQVSVHSNSPFWEIFFKTKKSSLLVGEGNE
jgi:hypothetical protein